MADPIVFDKKPAILELEAGTYWWCSCGRSKKQPWCDGSHSGTGMGPMSTEIAEKKTVSICNCKHSKGAPFCDGSHGKL